MLVSVAAGLLLVGAAGLGYLWWDTADELARTRTDLQAQVEELAGTVESRDSELDRLSEQLQQTRDDLASAQTQLEGTENMVALLEDQQDVIRECIVQAGEVSLAIENGQTPSQAELDAVDEACAEAGEILDL